jgi:quinolinate synthase
MAMNGLRNLAEALENGGSEIAVERGTAARAHACIDRMLRFAADAQARVRPGPDLGSEQALFAGVGPA